MAGKGWQRVGTVRRRIVAGALGISGVQSRKTRASVVRGADHVGGEHTWGTVAKYRERFYGVRSCHCGSTNPDALYPIREAVRLSLGQRRVIVGIAMISRSQPAERKPRGYIEQRIHDSKITTESERRNLCSNRYNARSSDRLKLDRSELDLI